MMIKFLRDLLKAYWKEQATAQINLQKSKLLIYDEYLKKYVGADELLIPGEKTKGNTKGAVFLDESKDYLLFDLLLKKFVNPKLDILTPGINNKSELSAISNFKTKNGKFSTSSSDFFWGKKKKRKRHQVVSLPPYDTSYDIKECSSTKVGWAGQTTKKPITHPRPEHSKNNGCSTGPERDTNKKKPPRKKEPNKKFIVCSKAKKDNKVLMEEDNISGNKDDNKTNPTSSNSTGTQEEECLPISKEEATLSSELLKPNNLNDCRESTHENQIHCKKSEECVNVENVNKRLKNEMKSVFKKICCQLFSNGKSVEKTAQKVELPGEIFLRNKSCSDVKEHNTRANVSNKGKGKISTVQNTPVDCNPTSKPVQRTEDANCDSKVLLSYDQDQYILMCNENKSIRGKKHDICQEQEIPEHITKTANVNQESHNNNKPAITDNVSIKSFTKLKSINQSNNQTKQSNRQTPLSNVQSVDKISNTKKISAHINLKEEKECSKYKSGQSPVDSNIDKIIKECKKALGDQNQKSLCKKNNLQNTHDAALARSKTKSDKIESDKHNSPGNMNYNFMVDPKTSNFQESCSRKDEYTEEKNYDYNNKLIKKECKDNIKVIDLKGQKEQRSVSATIDICKLSTEVSKPMEKKSSPKEVLYTKKEKNICKNKEKPVKGTLSLPNLNDKCKTIHKLGSVKDTGINRLKETSKSALKVGLTKPLKIDNTINLKKSEQNIKFKKAEKCNKGDITVKSKTNSTLLCQHIEQKVTEKLESIAQRKSFDEAEMCADKTKCETYMGFKIKKSCSEPKVSKEISHISEKICDKSNPSDNKTATSMQTSKPITRSLNQTKSTKVSNKLKKNQRNATFTKSDQCLKKELENRVDSQKTCSNKTEAAKSNYKTNVSIGKHDSTMKPFDLCSNKLKKEGLDLIHQSNYHPKQHLNKPEKPKSACVKQSKGESISTNKMKIKDINSKSDSAERMISEENRSSCITENTDTSIQEFSNILLKESEDKCNLEEESATLTTDSLEVDICKKDLLCENKEVSNMNENVCTETDNSENSDEKCEVLKEIENEQCKENKQQRPYKEQETCAVGNIIQESQDLADNETLKVHCIKPNQDLESNTAGSPLLSVEKKKEKHSKVEKKSELVKTISLDSLPKKSKAHKTKSAESLSTKPWKRSGPNQPQKSRSAAICPSNKSTSKVKQNVVNLNIQSKDSDKYIITTKETCNTKSSPNVSFNLNSDKVVKSSDTNKSRTRKTNFSKLAKSNKYALICSKSSPNLITPNKRNKTLPTNITPTKSNGKINTTSSKTNATKQKTSQKLSDESKHTKKCSLHTLQKKVNENPVKVSKRVEIKSFSELKSVSNSEVNKLVAHVGTKGLHRTQSELQNAHFETDKNPLKESANVLFKTGNKVNDYDVYRSNVEEIALKSNVLENTHWCFDPPIQYKKEGKIESKPPLSTFKCIKDNQFQKIKQCDSKDKTIQKKIHNGEFRVKNLYTVKNTNLDNRDNSKLMKKNNQNKSVSGSLTNETNFVTMKAQDVKNKYDIDGASSNKYKNNLKKYVNKFLVGTDNQSFRQINSVSDKYLPDFYPDGHSKAISESKETKKKFLVNHKAGAETRSTSCTAHEKHRTVISSINERPNTTEKINRPQKGLKVHILNPILTSQFIEKSCKTICTQPLKARHTKDAKKENKNNIPSVVNASCQDTKSTVLCSNTINEFNSKNAMKNEVSESKNCKKQKAIDASTKDITHPKYNTKTIGKHNLYRNKLKNGTKLSSINIKTLKSTSLTKHQTINNNKDNLNKTYLREKANEISVQSNILEGYNTNNPAENNYTKERKEVETNDKSGKRNDDNFKESLYRNKNKIQPSTENLLKSTNNILKQDNDSAKLSECKSAKISETWEGTKPSSAGEITNSVIPIRKLSKTEKNYYVKDKNAKLLSKKYLLQKYKSPKIKTVISSKPVLEHVKVNNNSALQSIAVEESIKAQNNEALKTVKKVNAPIKVNIFGKEKKDETILIEESNKTKNNEAIKTVKKVNDPTKFNIHDTEKNVGKTDKEFGKPGVFKLETKTYDRVTNKIINKYRLKKSNQSVNNNIAKPLIVRHVDQSEECVDKVKRTKIKTQGKKDQDERIETPAKERKTLIGKDVEFVCSKKTSMKSLESTDYQNTEDVKIEKPLNDKRLNKIAKKDPVLKNRKCRQNISNGDFESSVNNNHTSKNSTDGNMLVKDSDTLLKANIDSKQGTKPATVLIKTEIKAKACRENDVKIMNERGKKNQAVNKKMNIISSGHGNVGNMSQKNDLNRYSLLVDKNLDKNKGKGSKTSEKTGKQNTVLLDDETANEKHTQERRSTEHPPMKQSAKCSIGKSICLSKPITNLLSSHAKIEHITNNNVRSVISPLKKLHSIRSHFKKLPAVK